MHRLRLFSPLKKWKKGDLPLSPYVHLSIGTYGSEDGNVLLSPQLMTAKEIDEVVNSMKRELEEFRKKAKQELQTLKSKIH
jgi:hypothetical protein